MPEMIPAPVNPGISFDDLQKIDIRAGTIRAVEDVPASGWFASAWTSGITHGRSSPA